MPSMDGDTLYDKGVVDEELPCLVDTYLVTFEIVFESLVKEAFAKPPTSVGSLSLASCVPGSSVIW